jgi:cytidyltransferase-like protein
MIVTTDQLPSLAGTVAMVDGGFDPLHAGHIEYFRAAADLGAPVLCNVSGDQYVSRKHPPLLPEDERVAVIDSIRHVDYVHLSRTATVEVLDRLAPRYYVKGEDWRDRLPPDEVEMCRTRGVEIVFLDTVTNSSSDLIADLVARMDKETDADEDS